MTNPASQASPLAEPIGGRRYAPRLALAALLAGAALFLLWWIDPRRLALPMCVFYTATGLHCPGCGATRATHDLLHGHLLSALHCNAIWVLGLPLALYAGLSEARRLVWGRPLPGSLLRRTWLLTTLAALVLVFSVLRNVPYYPFSLLAPLAGGPG